jgi:hypothetical protein
MTIDVGTILIDSRHAVKIAKSHMFGVLDFLEVIDTSEADVTLKMRSVICLNEEWVTCHNWSEAILLKKEDVSSYIKNDKFISGAIWLPIENNSTDLVGILNERNIKSIGFNKQLLNEIYSDSTVTDLLGKFL